MLSSPEILLKALGVEPKTQGALCMAYYQLGVMIGEYHRVFKMMPANRDIYAMWHENLPLGVPSKGADQATLNRCNEFAKKCDQLSSETGQDGVDKQNAGDETAT